LGGSTDGLIVEQNVETTYNIELRLEQDTNDNGEPIVKAVRTGEFELVIDVFDGAVWRRNCFRLEEQISLHAKDLCSYDGY